MSAATTLIYQLLGKTGSTWVSADELRTEAWKRGIVFDNILNDKNVVEYEGYYTTKKINIEEDRVAINVIRLLLCAPPVKHSDCEIESLICKFEETQNEGRKLHFHQKDAVKMIVNNNFCVLTGGAGTGKTTVLSCAVFVLRELNKKTRIVFTAPTGKAARRITESTKEYASTVHKKFGITLEGKEPIPLEEDTLFIDESSMNDNEISSIIVSACATGKRIVMVGDVYQLLSVGLGAVLRDLIDSGIIPVTQLTHTFRQSNDSVLFKNITNIRNGCNEIIEGDDYHAIRLPDGCNQELEEMAFKLLKEKYVEQVKKWGVENVVLLLPYRRKGVCSNRLNNMVQRIVNRKEKGFGHFKKNENIKFWFCVDDYVMQLENRDECANGDVGQVVKVDDTGIDVSFVDGIVHYNPEELDQLSLAYAMSIHKSQGSEYNSVIMALLEEHTCMLQRNMLYTGVTRGKKEVTLIYQQKAYDIAVSTLADKSRKTMLKEKLLAVYARYRMVYGI